MDKETRTIHTIKKDSVISIDVSGHFYKRITTAYFQFISKFKSEKLDELMIAVRDDKTDTLKTEDDISDAYTIQTLLILISEIELQFQEKKLINPQEIELPTVDSK